jgi:hypothetical protein
LDFHIAEGSGDKIASPDLEVEPERHALFVPEAFAFLPGGG